MNMNKQALINYYARLIKKGQYTIDKVEPELREEVEEKIKELPNVEDTEISTPALGQSPTQVNHEMLGL